MEMKFDNMGFITAITILCFATIAIALYLVTINMAKKRGRSQMGWFLFSLIFSPILAIIFLLLLGQIEDKEHKWIIKDRQHQNHHSSLGITPDEEKCSQCAEIIKVEARVCRFCGYEKDTFISSRTEENSFPEWKRKNPNGTLNEFYKR